MSAADQVHLNLELHAEVGDLGRHSARVAHVRQNPSQQPGRVGDVQVVQSIGGVDGLVHGHQGLLQQTKAPVVDDVHALVVRAQIVHLLLEQTNPQLLAEILHGVEFIAIARVLFGESFAEGVTNAVT